jgi:hypothetical protein
MKQRKKAQSSEPANPKFPSRPPTPPGCHPPAPCAQPALGSRHPPPSPAQPTAALPRSRPELRGLRLRPKLRACGVYEEYTTNNDGLMISNSTHYKKLINVRG